jgi:hypothetical protein
MPVYTVRTERIPELPGRGRLGRHVRRDSRAAAYPYRRSAAAISSVTWTRHIPILNQGNTSGCTGNAETGALGTDPLFPALPPDHPILDEDFALLVYSNAEIIDGGAGLPAEDDGSSGQSVCQAVKTMGLISGYTWCSDLDDTLDALMSGPVLLGVNWYTSFDDPPASGVMTLPATATVRGGHEIVCRRVDVAGEVVWCDQSWGLPFGINGSFGFPYEVLDQLLGEDGDCAVPLPLTVPAPAPVPVPVVPVPVPVPGAVHVDSADLAFNSSVPAGWTGEVHVGGNERVAGALSVWRQAKGLTAG